MPALDILKGILPPPGTSKDVWERRRVLISHPLVQPDYSIARKKAKTIAEDLKRMGFKKATPAIINTDLRFYKTAFEFLTNPTTQEKILEKIKNDDRRAEFSGVKALINQGIWTLEDLPISQEEDEEDEEEKALPTPDENKNFLLAIQEMQKLIKVGEAARFLLERFQKSEKEREKEKEELEQKIYALAGEIHTLRTRVEELEQENSVLEDMADEVERNLSALRKRTRVIREAEEREDKADKQKPPKKKSENKKKAAAPTLPQKAAHFNSFKFVYRKEFLEAYKKRQRNAQHNIVRKLENIHPFNLSSTRVRTVKPEQDIRGLPEDVLLTTASNWRIAWKVEDKKIVVYNLIGRGSKRLQYTES